MAHAKSMSEMVVVSVRVIVWPWRKFRRISIVRKACPQRGNAHVSDHPTDTTPCREPSLPCWCESCAARALTWERLELAFWEFMLAVLCTHEQDPTVCR